MGEIILNCKNCNSEVNIQQTNDNQYSIECCDVLIKSKIYEEVINNWNYENNKFHHVFGVIFNVNYDDESMKKELDSFYVYDELLVKKALYLKQLVTDEVFKFDFEYCNSLFPEVSECKFSLKGMDLRRSVHMPNYGMYKFITDFGLDRKDLQTLLDSWSMKQLNTYKFSIGGK